MCFVGFMDELPRNPGYLGAWANYMMSATRRWGFLVHVSGMGPEGPRVP